MRHLLLVFLALPSAHADFCNWGIVPTAPLRCDGETYYQGTAACDSGFYKNIFCHEKFYHDGAACAADASPKTMECYKRVHAPAPLKPASKDACNWGFVGPKSFTCGQQRYCYGSAACTSGFYKDVFCRMDLCQDGKTCAEDVTPATLACFAAMKTPRAAGGEVLHLESKTSTGANQ